MGLDFFSNLEIQVALELIIALEVELRGPNIVSVDPRLEVA